MHLPSGVSRHEVECFLFFDCMKSMWGSVQMTGQSTSAIVRRKTKTRKTTWPASTCRVRKTQLFSVLIVYMYRKCKEKVHRKQQTNVYIKEVITGSTQWKQYWNSVFWFRCYCWPCKWKQRYTWNTYCYITRGTRIVVSDNRPREYGVEHNDIVTRTSESSLKVTSRKQTSHVHKMTSRTLQPSAMSGRWHQSHIRNVTSYTHKSWPMGDVMHTQE